MPGSGTSAVSLLSKQQLVPLMRLSGAGIRIVCGEWRAAIIERALQLLIASSSSRSAAEQLQAEFEAINGRHVTGKLIWDVLGRSTAN